MKTAQNGIDGRKARRVVRVAIKTSHDKAFRKVWDSVTRKQIGGCKLY